MTVDKYILVEGIGEAGDEPQLMRIVFIDGAGFRGEEYYGGRWQPHPGALSYMFDPSPGDFINEEEAAEVMRRIDQSG